MNPISGSNTYYMGAFIDTSVASTESTVQVAAGAAGTLSSFEFNVSSSPGFGASWTVTVRKNGANTSVTCTISGAATSCTDSSHTASFSAGDTLSIRIVGAGGPGAGTPLWHATYQ